MSDKEEDLLEEHLRKKLEIARQVFHNRSVRAGLLENRITDLWDLLYREEREFLESVELARMALKDLKRVGQELTDYQGKKK